MAVPALGGVPSLVGGTSSWNCWPLSDTRTLTAPAVCHGGVVHRSEPPVADAVARTIAPPKAHATSAVALAAATTERAARASSPPYNSTSVEPRTGPPAGMTPEDQRGGA